MTEWEDDKVMLSVAAAVVASEFDSLKRIGDQSTKELWHGYVPAGDVVKTFWPYLVRAMNKLSPNKICKAEIVFSAVDDRIDDADYIYATGIKVTYVTDTEATAITEANAKQLLG